MMFLTVLALTTERYIAICHPFLVSKLNMASLSRAIKIILIIWLFGILFPVPRCFRMSATSIVIDNTTRIACVTISKSIWVHFFPIVVFYSSLFVICSMNILIGISLNKSTKTMANHNEENRRKSDRAPKIICE